MFKTKLPFGKFALGSANIHPGGVCTVSDMYMAEVSANARLCAATSHAALFAMGTVQCPFVS